MRLLYGINPDARQRPGSAAGFEHNQKALSDRYRPEHSTCPADTRIFTLIIIFSLT
jgi:hypothetical protein